MQVEIEKTNGSIETMGITEFARWMCLVEAFFFIEEKAKELKIKVDGLIKPTAIDEYIQERYPSMLHDVTCEHKLKRL